MIEIRKGGTLRTTWEELKTNIKNNTSSLNVGDELDIVLKTGPQTMKSVLVQWGLILANYSIYCQTIYKKL